MVVGNISLSSLPPNCTSVHKPLDMELLVALKKRYKKYMMFEWLVMLENRKELTTKYKKLTPGIGSMMCETKINLGDAAQIAVRAWAETQQEHVICCWIKAKILPLEHEALINSLIISKEKKDTSLEDDIHELSELMFSKLNL